MFRSVSPSPQQGKINCLYSVGLVFFSGLFLPLRLYLWQPGASSGPRAANTPTPSAPTLLPQAPSSYGVRGSSAGRARAGLLPGRSGPPSLRPWSFLCWDRQTDTPPHDGSPRQGRETQPWGCPEGGTGRLITLGAASPTSTEWGLWAAREAAEGGPTARQIARHWGGGVHGVQEATQGTWQGFSHIQEARTLLCASVSLSKIGWSL